jgi:hypothetical protein
MMKLGSRVDSAVALSIAAVCLGLYLATMTPGLAYSGGDGHELTVAAATLGLAHPTGYPLYTWLAWLFIHLLPVGEIAHRLNLMSAVLGASAMGLLYLVGRRLGLERLSAAAGALFCGVSTTLWSQAVVTEVYVPNVFMVLATLSVALAWGARVASPGAPSTSDRLVPAFALIYGLSLGTHLSNLGFAPAYALFVLLTDWRIVTRVRTVVLAVGAFLLGAAQFAWLPLRASVNDLFPNAAPDNLERFYRYTLGAFSNLRFQFPLSALPGRLGVYAGLLADNFGVVGMGLGLVGLWACWWRDLRVFWLLALMWGVHVAFFTQLLVPDPDPFFVASNVLFAIFIGFGVQVLSTTVRRLLGVVGGRMAALLTAVALAVPLSMLARSGLAANDRRTDTLLADFYRAAFASMPQGSVLVTRRGAFGADVFYWHHLYHVRPDLIVASERGAPVPPPDALRFSTDPKSPVGAPQTALPDDAWYVPVLFGNRFDLGLYRVQAAPPALVATGTVPLSGVERRFGDVTLVGWSVTSTAHAGGRSAHVETFWRLGTTRDVVVATEVGDLTLESHMLGLGNLARYDAQIGMASDAVLVEAFDVVLPSALPPGSYPLRVGVVAMARTGIDVAWADVGTVTVE